MSKKELFLIMGVIIFFAFTLFLVGFYFSKKINKFKKRFCTFHLFLFALEEEALLERVLT